MTRNLDIPNSKDFKSKTEKNLDKSLTQKGACYRGFTSIDQEMEREIALQWFKPMGKGRFVHRGLYESNSK